MITNEFTLGSGTRIEVGYWDGVDTEVIDSVMFGSKMITKPRQRRYFISIIYQDNSEFKCWMSEEEAKMLTLQLAASLGLLDKME